MVKIYRLLLLVLLIALLSACNFPGSESYVQTQVAEALATRAIEDTQVALVAAQTSQAQAIEQTQTTDAFLSQTQTVEAGFTATSEPTETATATPLSTATPQPSSTPAYSGIPEGQITVEAKGNAAWWRKKGENNVGYPVMVKLDPVQRYEPGDLFRVYDYQIRADGNVYFYQIAGPLGAGYYVRVGDVEVK